MAEGRAERSPDKETKSRIFPDQGHEGYVRQQPRLWVIRAFFGRNEDTGYLEELTYLGGR